MFPVLAIFLLTPTAAALDARVQVGATFRETVAITPSTTEVPVFVRQESSQTVVVIVK